MVDMLTMWFWAYVIGVFLAAAITLFAILVVIRGIMQRQKQDQDQKSPQKQTQQTQKPTREESPLERWKRGGLTLRHWQGVFHEAHHSH